MSILKKLTTKIVKDVKETVKEESQKTIEEVKNDVANTVSDNLPVIVLLVASAILVTISRKPVPVMVKVVVKQV